MLVSLSSAAAISVSKFSWGVSSVAYDCAAVAGTVDSGGGVDGADPETCDSTADLRAAANSAATSSCPKYNRLVAPPACWNRTSARLIFPEPGSCAML